MHSPSQPGPYSACVPCCNNAATIRQAVNSLLQQTIPPAEVLVIDDGSTDATLAQLNGLAVRVIRHEQNRGRGAARARAINEARHGLVLCCDATKTLEPTFFERGLAWFEDPQVAAVFGAMAQTPTRRVADRWRGRHLFKIDAETAPRHQASLSTWGAIMRVSAARAAGNFDAKLRHSEDADLGARLLKAGFDVVMDPRLKVIDLANNTVAEVLERYWRWYAGSDEKITWRIYFKLIIYSLKVMAVQDFRAKDFLCIPISLACPHYQFWKSILRARRKG